MLANKLEYLALDEEYVLSMNRPQWTTKSYSIFATGDRKYILKPTHDPAKKLNRGPQRAWTFSPSITDALSAPNLAFMKTYLPVL